MSNFYFSSVFYVPSRDETSSIFLRRRIHRKSSKLREKFRRARVKGQKVSSKKEIRNHDVNEVGGRTRWWWPRRQ